MESIVRAAFQSAVARFQVDAGQAGQMPLDRWNESVFRYFYCHSVASSHPHVQQFVECDKIDLVLALNGERAFIEFKFYQRSQRFDAYTSSPKGFKGGPSSKNLAELNDCVSDLVRRVPAEGLGKYLILVYSDPAEKNLRQRRYSEYCEKYAHGQPGIVLDVIESSGPFAIGGDMVSARLFRVSTA